jgi:hypothetical protein
MFALLSAGIADPTGDSQRFAHTPIRRAAPAHVAPFRPSGLARSLRRRAGQGRHVLASPDGTSRLVRAVQGEAGVRP